MTLHGPARDLHSGIFGGTVDNPAMALCQLLGKLRERTGASPSRVLRRRRSRCRLTSGSSSRACPSTPRVPEIPGRAGIVRRAGLHPDRTALRPAHDLKINGLDQRRPGRGQQDHRAIVGTGQGHYPPLAARPGPGPRQLRWCGGILESCALRPCAWKSIRHGAASVSGLSSEPTSAGCVAPP